MSAFDPVIRGVHNAVNLSETVSDAQAFIDDTLKLAKPQSDKPSQASVQDFIKLLETHSYSSHKFLHQVCKNSKDLVAWYKEFGTKILAEFRNSEDASKVLPTASEKLNALYNDLSASDQTTVLREIDRHAEYLQKLSDSSSERVRAALQQSEKTAYGPGIYLARWQALLDNTEITPLEPEGSTRKAGDEEAKEASRMDVDGEKKGDASAEKAVEEETAKAPEVGTTVKLLMSKFWEMLRNREGEK